jgi:hypothetical protein
MGTRRRHRRHRGGDPFIPDKTAVGPAAREREKKRYEAWLAKRKVEAVEDAKGREEDAKMADFYAKQKRERSEELVETAKQREEADIESTRAADEKARRSECRNHLRSHDPSLSSPKAANEWLANKSNMRANPQDYKEVRDCVRILTSSKDGAGRKTRRRKSRRRR